MRAAFLTAKQPCARRDGFAPATLQVIQHRRESALISRSTDWSGNTPTCMDSQAVNTTNENFDGEDP